jgi:hypothetical protein
MPATVAGIVVSGVEVTSRFHFGRRGCITSRTAAALCRAWPVPASPAGRGCRCRA